MWLLLGCGGDPGLRGVVVVSLDTLRADRLGVYGSTAGLTPNLDRFAAEAVVYEAAYAQSNETLFSHASLFTSRYPHELDTLDLAFRVPPGTPSLASVFGDAGWETAGFVAGGHLSAPFGLGEGFQTWDDAEAWGSLRDTGTRALRWLDARDGGRPFFLFVHGYDTHDRYLKPPPFGYAFADRDAPGPGPALGREPGATSRIVAGRFGLGIDELGLLAARHPRFGTGLPDGPRIGPGDVAHLAGLYDGSVAWADVAFGLLVAGLDARGLLDEVAMVVLSDHGEELGETGAFHHRYGLDDRILHVPLMVRVPGEGARREPGIVELVDVAPSLWAIAGVHGPAVRGRPFAPRPSAVSEGALQLLSVRGESARLTSNGLSLANALAPALLAVAPVDGVSLTVEGDPSGLPGLRAAMVAHLEAR